MMLQENIYFIPLGGGQQVGASCYFLKIGTHNILLDCGIGFHNGLIYEPNLRFLQQTQFIESLNQIDQVFISHAHLDHIGNLPYLMKCCPNVPIFMTETSKKLCYYQLYDKNFYHNYLLENKESERLALKFLFDRVVPVSYLESLMFNDLKVTFFPAGHIPGAMMVCFEYKGKTILYTGDYSTKGTPLTGGCLLPQKKIDVLITCALHAKNSSYMYSKNRIKKILEKIYLSLNNGISAFCQIKQLSKGLEFIEYLNNEIERNNFPLVDIYIDNSIYSIIQTVEKSIKPIIKANIHPTSNYPQKKPCIYLSTSQNIKEKNYFSISVDFSLHDDFYQTKELIKKINPKTVILVHTADFTNNYDGDTIETSLTQDPENMSNFIFAENEEIYLI